LGQHTPGEGTQVVPNGQHLSSPGSKPQACAKVQHVSHVQISPSGQPLGQPGQGWHTPFTQILSTQQVALAPVPQTRKAGQQLKPAEGSGIATSLSWQMFWHTPFMQPCAEVQQVALVAQQLERLTPGEGAAYKLLG
jgi:hypothetical protein